VQPDQASVRTGGLDPPLYPGAVPDFPRTARLDVGAVLRQLVQVTGTVLTEDGACPGGQAGAAYVRWPDGHRSVLTSRPAGSLASVRQSEALLALGRAAGIPAPRYELTAELPSAVRWSRNCSRAPLRWHSAAGRSNPWSR
jgi:hypothetical protein